MTIEAPLKVIQPQQRGVPPSLSNMESVTIEEGQGVVLSTEVSGTPAPKVQWYREGTLIPMSPDFEVSINRKFLYCLPNDLQY